MRVFFFHTHAINLVLNEKLELSLIWRNKSFLCSLHTVGSNGHEFMFLLKGHEDLRQDERVMQLFGLVNTLLANDPASLRKNLRQASCIHAIRASYTVSFFKTIYIKQIRHS